MKSQLALVVSASLLLLSACATATPENPGRFMSHDETIKRCGVANYTFRHTTDCSGAPAPVAAAPKAEAPAPVAAAPQPSLRKQIYFNVGSTKIGATHNGDITSAVEAMKASPSARVEVQGYADGSGDLTKNQALAKRRANAVRDAITAQGIDTTRIELVKPSQAVGEQVADTTQKANDRRVEIRVY